MLTPPDRSGAAALRIRPARAEEALALARLAWAAKASWGYTTAQLNAWRDGLSPSPASIETQPTFVAEAGATRLAGFCQLNLNADPVELDHLWVHPEFMGQGVGRSLLGTCLGVLAEAGIEVLHIDADPNAEPFYLACGAHRVGEIHAPIEGQADRVRPQLRLCATPAKTAPSPRGP